MLYSQILSRIFSRKKQNLVGIQTKKTGDPRENSKEDPVPEDCQENFITEDAKEDPNTAQ